MATPWRFVAVDGGSATEGSSELGGFTLLVPALGIGNVCQLAIDALLQNASFVKLGHLYTPALQAVVGTDPISSGVDSSGSLCHSAELYAKRDRGIAILQLRAFAHPGLQEAAVQHIFEFTRACSIARVVVVSGCDASFVPERLMTLPSSARTACRALHLTVDKEASFPLAAVDAGLSGAGAQPLFSTIGLGEDVRALCERAWAHPSPASSGAALEAAVAGSPAFAEEAAEKVVAVPAAEAEPEAASRQGMPGWRPVTSLRARQVTQLLFGGTLWGCGYTPLFLRRALQDGEDGLPQPRVSVLLAFAYEGGSGRGNLGDACELAHLLAIALGMADALPLARSPPAAAGGAGEAGAAPVASDTSGKPKRKRTDGQVKVTTSGGVRLTLPAYFCTLHGRPIDYSTGMYGF